MAGADHSARLGKTTGEVFDRCECRFLYPQDGVEMLGVKSNEAKYFCLIPKDSVKNPPLFVLSFQAFFCDESKSCICL